ncbi:MAG: class I SAM-dependent methyltransferase [Candidatus Pacebacteria bacterium]|nr:class I SAM-dependent methyltransferase [Candidatus Paceibacterota bacterium]
MEDQRKNFFSQAYLTGTDIWTLNDYRDVLEPFISRLPNDSLILDLGSGRGRVDFLLAREGVKIIGLDYVPQIVEKNNMAVKMEGLEKSLRFKTGDVLDIPFTDSSFDAILDIGTLQHLRVSEWENYISEIARVTKPEGLVLLIELSKNNATYGPIKPKESNSADFLIHEMHYHFFTKEELGTMFVKDFETIALVEQTMGEDKALRFVTVLRRK